MKKVLNIISIAVFGIFLTSGAVHALPTQVIDLGDETVEQVQIGYSGDIRKESLSYWFDANGITNTDGSQIDPVEDQLQYELFHTDTDRDYQVEFLGIGYAGYHSPFGVFTYDGDPLESFDASLMTYYDPLFVQNEAPDNSTYDFSIGEDTYFGFYLNSNGKGELDEDGKPVGDSAKFLSTLVSSNAMPSSGRVQDKDSYTLGLDHALFFETNKGYTIAFEDIVGGGDADYEDLVINFSPTDGTGFSDGQQQPTPEPGTLLLLGIGMVGFAVFGRKRMMAKMKR